MKFFKDQNNEVFAIPAGLEHLVQEGWSAITEVEQEALAIIKDSIISEERLSTIFDRLMEIDVESIRPLRAIATHSDNLEDHQRLAKLNAERKALIMEMNVMKHQKD